MLLSCSHLASPPSLLWSKRPIYKGLHAAFFIRKYFLYIKHDLGNAAVLFHFYESFQTSPVLHKTPRMSTSVLGPTHSSILQLSLIRSYLGRLGNVRLSSLRSFTPHLCFCHLVNGDTSDYWRIISLGKKAAFSDKHFLSYSFIRVL